MSFFLSFIFSTEVEGKRMKSDGGKTCDNIRAPSSPIITTTVYKMDVLSLPSALLGL